MKPISAAPNCVRNVSQVVTLTQDQDLVLECEMSWTINTDITFNWVITASDARGNYTPVNIARDYITHRGNTSLLRLPSQR